MAYNTKYILNYCNRYGDKLSIELQVDGYVGQAFIIVNNEDYLQDDRGRFVTVNVDGSYDPERDKNKIEGSANPFSLTYRNDRGEKGGAIRATSATMEFFEDMLFNIDDLATSDETEFRCIFKYNDAIEWIGFVTPDFFTVAIESNPVISLTASDRIGILKDVSYTIDTTMDETVNKLSIVIKCLKETGLELPINVICDIYCDQFSELEGNPFANSYVHEWRAVKDIEKKDTDNCYVILQQMMDEYNCLLTQYKGEWWIVNKYNQERGSGKLWKYDSNGIPISNEQVVFGETFFNEIDTGGQRTIIPAGAKNTYLLKNGPEIVYPLNYTLQDYIGNMPEYWNEIGSLLFLKTNLVPTSYLANGNVDEYYQDSKNNLRITDYILGDGDLVALNVRWNWDNLTSDSFRIGSVSGETLSVTLSVKAVGKPNTGILTTFCLYFPGSNLVFRNSNINDETWYCDSLDSLNNPSTIVPIAPFKFDNKYNDVNLAVNTEFKTSKTTSIAALKKRAASSHFVLNESDFTTAQGFVKIYPCFTPDTNIAADVVIREIKVTYENDNQVPKGVVYQTMLDGRFTKPTERRDLMWGDFQTFGQNGYFYKYREDSLSIIYNQAGQMTKDWYTPWDNSRQPLLLHSLRQLTRTYARAHDELRIGFDLKRIDPFTHFAIRCVSQKYIQVNEEDNYLQDVKSRYITANIGKYLNNKRFILVEGTIDYLRSSFSGVLAEIVNTDKETTEYIYSYFEDSNIK
ncbi:hypothetical protein [Sphingobacterium sp.]|uniref:hypothetical protein n=1 Tax=Sphingobacterium sp. TaxID=341027 RepID=UPI0028AA2466|nr:hypothetical protein [Sphingobacterium sp.]